ncbi:hypothetical protein [Asanoa ishikariensis]|uniref:hypothetical protein n=1 Tax=Asanoa ishikariensis TaxID=137265 RepID=UPI00194FAC51|nr:hypothetical protein [Asanoa ishikariensis]
MAYRHPAAFLLGMEGLALLRAFAGEFDAAFVAARLAETRDILAVAERGELARPTRSARPTPSPATGSGRRPTTSRATR